MSAARREFAHVQARVQARYGRLPAEADWRRISGVRALGAWLEDARVGPLRAWVKGFSAASTAADIEVGVRNLLWTEIDAVADYAPCAWQASIAWTAWLPLAGVFGQLRAGGALPDWARALPQLATLLDDAGSLVQAQVERAGIGPLLDPAAGPLLEAWGAGWRQRWPRPGAAVRADLNALAQLLGAHLSAFNGSPPARAWTCRQELRERLRFRFHALGLSPAAPFTYLALVALDLERLRRALLDRALFPTVPAVRTHGEAA